MRVTGLLYEPPHPCADVSYTYSDFGETMVSGNTSNEFCYTGAVRDAATGMYYMNARYYDPETERFISQDTYRGEDDDAGTWHLYSYCSNNPINFTDPSGYKKVDIGAGFTLQASVGQIISSYSIGLTVLWYTNKIKKKNQFKGAEGLGHVYLHVDTGLSAGLKEMCLNTFKAKRKSIFSKSGLKSIKKALYENARLNASLSVIFFIVTVQRKVKKFIYKDFAGDVKNTTLTAKHISVNRGKSNMCNTTGIGFSSASYSTTRGFSYYGFSEWGTNKLKKVFSKKNTRNTANS